MCKCSTLLSECMLFYVFYKKGLVLVAIIFFFSAFEEAKEEPDWSVVYPELAYMKDPDKKGTAAQQLD